MPQCAFQTVGKLPLELGGKDMIENLGSGWLLLQKWHSMRSETSSPTTARQSLQRWPELCRRSLFQPCPVWWHTAAWCHHSNTPAPQCWNSRSDPGGKAHSSREKTKVVEDCQKHWHLRWLTFKTDWRKPHFSENQGNHTAEPSATCRVSTNKPTDLKQQGIQTAQAAKRSPLSPHQRGKRVVSLSCKTHLLAQFLSLARVGRAWIICSQEHAVMERRKRREECFEGGYFALTQPTVPPNNSTKGAGSRDSETWSGSISLGRHVLASKRHADDTAETWGHNFTNQRTSHPETLTSLQEGHPAPRCKETAPNLGKDNLLQAPWGLTSVTAFLDCQQQELGELWMTLPKHISASACIHFQHHYYPCSSSNILTPQLSNSPVSQAPWISEWNSQRRNECLQTACWPEQAQGLQQFSSEDFLASHSTRSTALWE